MNASSKVAIVTGAARPDGIGWATALALADDGFSVIVTGSTEGEVRGAPAHDWISARHLDVRDDASINALFKGVERIDALVACAGAARGESEFTPEGFADVLNVNLTGTMRCCIAARPRLTSTGGAIVTVGSMYSLFGSAAVPAYSASKGGVVQLTKSLAVAWGPQVRVNCVLPGWIRTSMGKRSVDGTGAEAILARTPAARFGAPDDLAQVIRFLCSQQSRFVTGAVIPVDGGYHCSG